MGLMKSGFSRGRDITRSTPEPSPTYPQADLTIARISDLVNYGCHPCSAPQKPTIHDREEP